MEKISHFRRLLYSTLYLLPLFSISDVLSLYYGNLTSHIDFSTPIGIKLIKDFFLVISVFYFIFLKRERSSYFFSQASVWGLMTLVMLSISLTLIDNGNVMLIVAGLRWVLPFVLLCAAIGSISREDLVYVGNILKKIFIVHFIFQLLEWLFGGDYFGTTSLGLNARSPGIFVIPNTGGLFTVFCAFMYMYYSQAKNNMRMHIIFVFSAFLTGSGTAIVGILLLYLLDKIYSYRKVWAIFSPVILALLFGVMMIVLSSVRSGNYIQGSLGTRFGIIYGYIIDSHFFSMNFGHATNTAILLDIPSARVADSIYASILGNLGWIGMGIYILAVVYAFYISERYRDKELFVFVIIFSMVAFTSVISEAFPMNYISALLFAFFLRKRTVAADARLLEKKYE